MIQINTSEQVTSLLTTNNLVMLYFSGPNCAVCHSLKPKVEALLENVFPDITLAEIKTDKFPEVAARFSVFSLPVIIFFVEGREYIKEARTIDLALLEQKLAKIINLYLG